jgi:TonB family protein
MIKFLHAWSVGMTTNAQSFRQQRFIAFQISKTKLFLPILLLLLSVATFAQRNIKGRVVDSETNQPVITAIIRIPGKDIRTQADSEGYFKLAVEAVDSLIVESPDYPISSLAIPATDEFLIALDKSKIDESIIYVVVEETASFPGGMGKFYEYIGSTIRYPQAARREGATGRLFVEFVINADGAIDRESVKVLKGFHPDCDAEAIRIMQESPPWLPGKQRGKPVRQKMVLPIVFNLAGPAKTKRN